MTLTHKGLIVAAVHVALVGSLGAKLLVDRTTYPRVWTRTAPVDPNLPIRGRYVSLRVEARIGAGLDLPVPVRIPTQGPGAAWTPPAEPRPVRLVAEDGALVALPAGEDEGSVMARSLMRNGQRVAEIIEPLAYFIPDTATDPSRRSPGEELWVEVTIPQRGGPRPIRLGVKKDGTLTPLDRP